MQQGSDYISSYYPHHYAPNPNPNPNPSPTKFLPSNPIEPPSFPSAASAPPYSNFAAVADFPAYSATYPSYSHPPTDPIPNLPPSAPSYAQLQPQPQPQHPQSQPQPQSQSQYPSYEPYNISPYPPEQSPAASYPHLQQPYYPPAVPNYASPPNPNPNPNLNSSFSSGYSSYDTPYESHDARFDHGGGSSYFNESSSDYGLHAPSTYSDAGFRNDHPIPKDDGLGEGVYRYDGGRVEPYGARGTGSSLGSSWPAFDDYGRSTSFSGKDNAGSFSGKDNAGSTGKIVRAVPKVDTQQDVKNGVQKFRVKLLPEGGGQSTMDILCQIGLDGIRMLDPSTNRTLRVYPLDTVTRWEVSDSSIYTFWSKSSVDIEPRRIRLQSNSYTTSTILDTVTAATVQLKEMGGRDSLGKSKATDAGKLSDQPTEKKKGFVDWMNVIKPGNEEKDHWVPDEAVSKCTSCGTDFGAFVRKHHCRNCGDIFCDKCTQGRIALTAEEQAQPVRVCDRCMAEVSQRLMNAKEDADKSTGLHTHEDLARKLQEEMEKNKSSSGSKASDGSGSSGRRMREVACPICTVHLQVQVPASGSETIECGVCQHPFLVSAH